MFLIKQIDSIKCFRCGKQSFPSGAIREAHPFVYKEFVCECGYVEEIQLFKREVICTQKQ